jgi:putative heme-binding domain-containing protein
MGRVEQKDIGGALLGGGHSVRVDEPRWRIAEAIAKHGEDASDHNLPLMIWYGLEPLVPYNVDRSIQIAKTTPIPLLRQFIARRVASLEGEKPQSLAKLMNLLAEEKEPSKRADVLTGVAAALRGARRVDPPQGWDALRDELVGSNVVAVATPAKELAVVFGDGRTMDALKAVAADATADPNARRDALEVLVRSGEKDLAPLLKNLVTDRSVGAIAVRGLASVGAADTPDVLLKRFWQLPKDARADAVAALTVREPWALALLDNVEKGAVPKELVTASDARQMSSLGSQKVDERLSKVWGTIRTTPAAVRADIERMRGQLTPEVLAKAELMNGRGLYNRLCSNCHKLYGEGTAVGPDLTGGNRASLDYLLENLLDPSATVPEAYRSSVIVLKDGRVLTGVIAGQSENRLTLQTATDKQTLDAGDVEEIKQTELSLMPNGQLDRLTEEEVRDLIAYLQSKSQVPLAE